MSGGIFDLSPYRIHEIRGCLEGYGNCSHDNQGIVQVIQWQVIMILRIFHCVQYFSKSMAAHFDIKVLPMVGFSYDLVLDGVRVVERYKVFNEMQKSRLSLSRFGNRFLLGREIIVQR